MILPNLTESYNSQRDPVESDIPYCTLKSFPSNIEHCIQWARDKFESSFTLKPTMMDKFIRDNQPQFEQILNTLKTNENAVIDGIVQFAKILRGLSLTRRDCLALGRLKFEKYFANKAKNLLHNYPLNHLMNDGSLFWKLPRRPPQPLKFNPHDSSHLSFVKSFARLYSDMFKLDEPDIDGDMIVQFFEENESYVPVWHPKNQHIETDETKKKEEVNCQNSKDLSNLECAKILEKFMETTRSKSLNINPLSFEKDHDANGHVDFIHAAANLRASMYLLEQADRLLVKKIAG